MKNIVFVTKNMSFGGAERVIANLSNHFISKGYEITIIIMTNKEIFYKLNPTINIINIGTKKSKIKSYYTIRKVILSINPDVIISMPEEVGIYLIPALFFTKIPLIISERNNPWIMPWKKITRFMRKIFYPFVDGIVFQTNYASSYFSKKIRRKIYAKRYV